MRRSLQALASALAAWLQIAARRLASAAPVRRGGEILRARATRRWSLRLLAALLVFGALGFLAVPPLIHRALERQLSRALARPVAIDRLAFNPYTLTLSLAGLRVGRAGAAAGGDDFLDLRSLVVSASWSSLWHLAPIVDELKIESPRLRVLRSAPQRFNFSDLLQRRTRPSAPGHAPLRFAVSDIEIDDGAIRFDDRVLGQRHLIDSLTLRIPFIANLPPADAAYVQPSFSARIDGRPVTLAGRTQVFADAHASDLRLRADGLNLPQLVGYAPLPLPLAVSSGRLSIDVDLQFALHAGRPAIRLGGSLDLRDLALRERGGQPWFSARSIHLDADRIEPLRGVAYLRGLSIDAPRLRLLRQADGRLALQTLLASRPSPAPSRGAAAAPDLQLQHLRLQGGEIDWRDRGTAAPTALTIQGLRVAVDDLSTALDRPAHYSVAARLASGGTLDAVGALILHRRTLSGEFDLQRLALPVLQPYLAGVLAGHLTQGWFSAQLRVAVDGEHRALRVAPGSLTLEQLAVALPDRRSAVLRLARAEAKIDTLDTAAHRAELASVSLSGLAVAAERGGDGTIDLQRLLVRRARAPAAGAAMPAWHYRVGAVKLADSSLTWVDGSAPTPVRLRLDDVGVSVAGVSGDWRQAWPLQISARVGSHGRLHLDGRLRLQPLQTDLALEASAIDVAGFEPYVAQRLAATIAGALAYGRGRLQAERVGGSWRARYRGGMSLVGVRLLDKATSDRFAGWRRLSIAPLDAGYDAGGVDVDIGRIALSDFYARIFLDPSGRLNLANLFKQPQAPQQSLTRIAQAPLPASSRAPQPPPQQGPPLRLHIGAVVLSGGEVNYTDDYIKPNFSADLSGIAGSVGGFGSRTPEPAPVQLSARLNDNAPLAIDGHINPLVTPAFVDLGAKASEIELTNFSSYAAKYAGYPIVKGKLNVDLHYHLADGQLSADNHLFLDQLTFGPRVDSPAATHLPVLLAVALLKDAHGQIDVDVPVHGSLSDPQFSVGGLILRAFGNLLVKAATSPFRLLAHLFGAGQEPDYVGFAPGSASLTAAAQSKLDKLAQALEQRPALKLDLIGRAEPSSDVPALKRDAVEAQVRRQKLRDLLGHGRSIDPAQVTVTDEEYDKYLRRAYLAADFDKPRNFFGFVKSPPPPQMRQSLLDHAEVSDADLTALSQRRAAAVRRWLDAKIDPARVFVLSPKLNAAGIRDRGPATRVDFTLRR
ncbi:MAG: DUF748 domain-containing protein [Gammaproteobacteria bacterium]|nr:DUF748 domain-containing protein [Gammaproteobacteria bacterium]